MSKPGKIILWILGIFILGLLSVNMYLNISDSKVKVRETKVIRETVRPYYEREEINERIKQMQVEGGYDRVVDVYAVYTRDRSVAACIINNCVVFDVPVDIGFALCKRESGFETKAVHKNKSSTDYGLFQLNSSTFKALIKQNGIEWIMKPENNIHTAIRHLRWLYDRYGSWDLAIVHYNGDFQNGAKEHLIAVYGYERELDRRFNNSI